MIRDALKTAMLDSLRMNRGVVLVMVGYIVAAFIAGRLVGFDISLRLYSTTWLLVCLVTFLVVLIPVIFLQFYRHRPTRPVRFAWDRLKTNARIVERGLIALPCILLFPLFTSAFTSVKSAIPLMHPYRFDPLFARIDAIMHGGHAWELIHPIVGFPMVTLIVNFTYNLWFLVAWIVFALVTVLTSDRKLRQQYLLAFCGCWILLGSVAAIAFSSVGPCFYALVYPGDPYGPLMDYLGSVDERYPLWALSTQNMLWDSHISNATGLGSGISAMPSLHVAIAALNAILLSKLSRTAGILGWLYLGLILVGSVHLAWHYAIDGYASIVGVVLIWRVAGWWVARGAGTEPVPVASY